MANDTPETEQAPGPDESAQDAATEREARNQGWVPQDDFRGPEDVWVDASTFVKRGREINPILRSNNKRLIAQMDLIQKQNDELRETMQQFSTHHAETAKREYDRALSDLKAAKKVAIESGDTADALNIADQIDELKEAKPAAVPVVKPAPAQQDPELAAWAQENTWFGTEKVKTQLAMAAGEELHKEQPDLRGREFLAELESRLAVEFPSRFGNPRRTAPPMTAGRGAPRGPQTKGKTAADLPADARSAMKKFVGQKLLTEAQYLVDYFGE